MAVDCSQVLTLLHLGREREIGEGEGEGRKKRGERRGECGRGRREQEKVH